MDAGARAPKAPMAVAAISSAVDVRAAPMAREDDGEDERDRLVNSLSPLAAAAQRQRTRVWLVSSLGGVAALFLLLVYMVVHGSRGVAVGGPADAADAADEAIEAPSGGDLLRALPPDVAQHADGAADPCADFYQFSCGSWMREARVPADKTGVYLSFSTVQDANERALRQLVRDDYWPLVGELFGSCMDMASINASGRQPLAPALRAIARTASKTELFRLAGHLSRTGPSFLSGLRVAADERHAETYALYATQSGLSLPDPEYYSDADRFGAVADALRAFASTLLTLAGWDAADAQEGADVVVSFEQQVAALFVPKERLRDPAETYNLVSVADAMAAHPLLMGAFLNGTGIPGSLPNRSAGTTLIVETPAFFEAAERLVADNATSLEALQVVLAYNYVRALASQLSDPFVDAAFALYGQALGGQKQRRARWKVCLSRVTASLPDLMGKYFALKRFDRESGDLARALVAQVEAAMRAQLLQLDWLDAETRQHALWKLGNVSNLVGHPSSVEASANHLPFVLAPGNFSANMQTLAQFDFERAVARIGRPVDRSEWFMCAAEANAYYAPSTNQIVFPAGILQPPFFDRRRHPARNFGAIGSVIGHELTHGFDDTGRFYAGDGNLRDWWSNATAAEFRARAACLADQYSAFPAASAFDAVKVLGSVDGNFTLGENIADNGGLKLSFHAFKQFLATASAPSSGDSQYSGDGGEDENEDKGEEEREVRRTELSAAEEERLFFVSFAQAFCAKVTDETMAQRLAADPHAPEKWRVNGAVMNSDEFARAFSCPVGSPMNPRDKCRLW